MNRAKVVALYLPQFHPIPENDEWWGRGFTEWMNVAKARPLYAGHYQPNLPADLGFYDLRVAETRAAQAEMAQSHGIDAFCYYHYWFGSGRKLLERPFAEVLKSGEPKLPFMLCWANQTWSGVWHGLDKRILIEQTYPGEADERDHFAELLPAFLDERYLRVNGKPVFMIYDPKHLPDSKATMHRWREMALQAGLPGLYLIAEHGDPFWDAPAHGFDAFVHKTPFRRRRAWVSWSRPFEKLRGKWQDFRNQPIVQDYATVVDWFVAREASDRAIPVVMPNWDNTPRSGARGLVFENPTPAAFGLMLDKAMARTAARKSEDQLIFIKSWNEWAEGNHLEPGVRYGYGHLNEIKRRFRATQ